MNSSIRKEGSVNFDTELFYEIMEFEKQVYEADVINPNGDGSQWRTTTLLNPIEEAMARVDTTSYQELTCLWDGGHHYKLITYPGIAQTDRSIFYSSTMLAINEKSEMKEEAWDFLKYFLNTPKFFYDPSSPPKPPYAGVRFSPSVNRQTAAEEWKMVQGYIKVVENDTIHLFKSPIAEIIETTIWDYMNKYYFSFPEMEYVYSDNRLKNVILDALEKYYTGEIHLAEQLAQTLNNRVSIYLKE